MEMVQMLPITAPSFCQDLSNMIGVRRIGSDGNSSIKNNQSNNHSLTLVHEPYIYSDIFASLPEVN